jgi:UPF0755 protein
VAVARNIALAKSPKRSKKRSSRNKVLATGVRSFVIAVAAVFTGLTIYAFWYWQHPLEPGTESYEVKPGTTLRSFARQLRMRDVLPEDQTFVLFAYLIGKSRALKAGEYRFRRGISAGELLEQVVAGRVAEYPMVLLEGWTFGQVLAALDQAPKLAHTLRGLSHRAIMNRLGQSGLHPEGWFYPDTYYYARGATDLMILQRAYARMSDRLKLEWGNREANLPLRTPYEALILASIVEKETGRADERKMIAGVLINRLRKRMRLQTDPTVIYGLGNVFDGNLRVKDLKTDTPYNTYTRAGLPPTPIAMPGGHSLAAVLHPAPTRALYFVSRGDGSHEFSDTLGQHNAAVVKYQLGGKLKSIPAPASNTGAKKSQNNL